jgi:hypothetical protein
VAGSGAPAQRAAVTDGHVPAPPVPPAPGGGRLRRTLEARGEDAFRAFVRRSDDRRLERTIGTGQGLRLIFSAMQSQFVPSGAGGFTGDLLYELRATDGRSGRGR